MFTYPKPGERWTVNQILGMSQFVLHLRLAYETITRSDKMLRPLPIASSPDETSVRARL